MDQGSTNQGTTNQPAIRYGEPSEEFAGAARGGFFSGGGGKVIAVLLTAAGLGLLWKVIAPGGNASEAEAKPVSVLTTQQQLMREALDLAREAQAMQAENMKRMNDAMLECEGAPMDDSPYDGFGGDGL